MSVGRNDPCPCGSGKKYKKCCARQHQLEAKLADTRRDSAEVLGDDATIYQVYDEWRNAREVTDFNFMFDLLHEEGALRAGFGDREGFVAQCADGTAKIPSAAAVFRHLLIVGAKADLLQTIGLDDPRMGSVVCERIGLATTEKGWRITEFEQTEVSKDGGAEVSLAIFSREA